MATNYITASGKYNLNWFGGDKVPQALSQVLDDDALEDEEDDDDNLYVSDSEYDSDDYLSD